MYGRRNITESINRLRLDYKTHRCIACATMSLHDSGNVLSLTMEVIILKQLGCRNPIMDLRDRGIEGRRDFAFRFSSATLDTIYGNLDAYPSQRSHRYVLITYTRIYKGTST